MPTSLEQVGIFYFAWIALYSLINLVWDIRTPLTPPFHLAHLSGKLGVLYNAATFASSLLLLLSVFSVDVRKIAGDTVVPLLLAGFSGLFVAVSELCPYKPDKVMSGRQPPAE